MDKNVWSCEINDEKPPEMEEFIIILNNNKEKPKVSPRSKKNSQNVESSQTHTNELMLSLEPNKIDDNDPSLITNVLKLFCLGPCLFKR